MKKWGVLVKRLPVVVIGAVLLLALPLPVGADPEDVSAIGETENAAFVGEFSTPPRPITSLQASDTPNDGGGSISLWWEPSPDADSDLLTGYTVMRGEAENGPFTAIAELIPGKLQYKDYSRPKENHEVVNRTSYYYRVRVDGPGGSDDGPVSLAVQAKSQWFHRGKFPVFVAMLFFTATLVVYIQIARKNPDIYLRPIAGISHIDDAIGRATEMGRPILYVLGMGTASEIATIASFTILGRVAKKTAEFQTKLMVPNNEAIVMTIAQETVRTAYHEAGRPDLYSDEMVFFVTSMQFAYVAAVNGLMLREKTATNFYMGKFYAESLLLAETGNIAGSIQIAGTDEVAQLPFFITACDYTLIGEELYAASAYLGRDPLLLGALKAQDVGKALLILFALFGSLLLSMNVTLIKDWVTVALQ